MSNGEKTSYHRAAKAVRESSGSTRVWGVVTTLIGGLALVAAVGFVQMRDDVIVSKVWATETAPKWHDHADVRFDHLERPELAIQLAQATGALARVQEAAALAHDNAAAIGVIQNDLEHVKDGGTRRERMLERVLEKLDNLKVRSQ